MKKINKGKQKPLNIALRAVLPVLGVVYIILQPTLFQRSQEEIAGIWHLEIDHNFSTSFILIELISNSVIFLLISFYRKGIPRFLLSIILFPLSIIVLIFDNQCDPDAYLFAYFGFKTLTNFLVIHALREADKKLQTSAKDDFFFSKVLAILTFFLLNLCANNELRESIERKYHSLREPGKSNPKQLVIVVDNSEQKKIETIRVLEQLLLSEKGKRTVKVVTFAGDINSKTFKSDKTNTIVEWVKNQFTYSPLKVDSLMIYLSREFSKMDDVHLITDLFPLGDPEPSELFWKDMYQTKNVFRFFPELNIHQPNPSPANQQEVYKFLKHISNRYVGY